MYVKKRSNKARKSSEFHKRINASLESPNATVKKAKFIKAIAPVRTPKLNDEEKALRALLVELFPTVFNVENPLPLCCGIHIIIKQRLRADGITFSARKMRNVLTAWTGSLVYKKALITNPKRYDLTGQAVELIKIEQKKDALNALQIYLKQYEFNQAKKSKKSSKLP